MTTPPHDEVIAWIDSKIAHYQEQNVRNRNFFHNDRNGNELKPIIDAQIASDEITIASLMANRAGLERHQERLSIFHNCGEEDCREMVARRILESIYTDIEKPIRSVM